MHELGIMYHIVEQVERVARENRITEIEALVLQVGALFSVVPRYLYACFPAAADGTILENTTLEIESLPANGICKECGTVFDTIENLNMCPDCKSRNFELISGGGFFIKEIRGA